MAFQRETEMARPVLDWLRGQGMLVKHEYSHPWGICDLVAMSFHLVHIQKRLALRQSGSIGPMRRVSMLTHIPDQESGLKVSFGTLREACAATECDSLFEKDLSTLIARRFVVRHEDGSLQKINGWAPIHDRIVAVELKLSRISEVVAQAISNRAFATESYIGLPLNVARRLLASARRDDLLNVGIGVLAIEENVCEVALAASHQGAKVDCVLQMHCAERFWRTRDNSSSVAEPPALVS